MPATAAYGAQLQMGDGATPTEAFTTIGGVKDLTGPGITRELVESTSHDAVDGYETHVPTIKRSGDVSFDLNWDPADGTHNMATGLGSRADDDNPTNFRLVYPRLGYRWQFSGYVTAFGPVAAPVAGLHSAPVTIKVVGKPALVVSA